MLAEVTGAIAAVNVNIEAICSTERGYEFFIMVTDNHTKAKNVITKMEGAVHLEDMLALELPNKVGQLEKVTKIIAKAGIDILFDLRQPR